MSPSEIPRESRMLTREEMQVGMRVRVPDFQGTITAMDDQGVSVKFDHTTGSPITWRWEGLVLYAE